MLGKHYNLWVVALDEPVKRNLPVSIHWLRGAFTVFFGFLDFQSVKEGCYS